MRDGNVSLRWIKRNYQLVPENSLLLIIFLVQFSERTAPVFICCLDDFHHCEQSDIFHFQEKYHQIGWLVVKRLK